MHYCAIYKVAFLFLPVNREVVLGRQLELALCKNTHFRICTRSYYTGLSTSGVVLLYKVVCATPTLLKATLVEPLLIVAFLW